MKRHLPIFREMVYLKGKLIIIVNGKPRAGKDTFALLLKKQ